MTSQFFARRHRKPWRSPPNAVDVVAPAATVDGREPPGGAGKDPDDVLATVRVHLVAKVGVDPVVPRTAEEAVPLGVLAPIDGVRPAHSVDPVPTSMATDGVRLGGADEQIGSAAAIDVTGRRGAHSHPPHIECRADSAMRCTSQLPSGIASTDWSLKMVQDGGEASSAVRSRSPVSTTDSGCSPSPRQPTWPSAASPTSALLHRIIRFTARTRTTYPLALRASSQTTARLQTRLPWCESDWFSDGGPGCVRRHRSRLTGRAADLTGPSRSGRDLGPSGRGGPLSRGPWPLPGGRPTEDRGSAGPRAAGTGVVRDGW